MFVGAGGIIIHTYEVFAFWGIMENVTRRSCHDEVVL
jgi:hypothetical protein